MVCIYYKMHCKSAHHGVKRGCACTTIHVYVVQTINIMLQQHTDESIELSMHTSVYMLYSISWLQLSKKYIAKLEIEAATSP